MDLDEHLTLKAMIDTTYSKANQKVFLLRRICPYMTAGMANQRYKTCILPILDYADFLVDSNKAINIEKLSSIQQRCLRVIDNQHQNVKTVWLMR